MTISVTAFFIIIILYLSIFQRFAKELELQKKRREDHGYSEIMRINLPKMCQNTGFLWMRPIPNVPLLQQIP